MKKIISLLSAFAMIFSLVTTVAFADENNVVYFEETRTETDVVLTLFAKTNLDITSISVNADLTDAYNKGVRTFTKAKGPDGATFNVVMKGTQNALIATYANADKGTGTLELGTVTFKLSEITEDFTINERMAFAVKSKDEAEQNIDLTAQFTNSVYGYVVKAPVAETTKYTVTYKVDDTQYGDPVEVEEGKTVVELPTAPTKEGFTFTGWVIEGTETAFTAETTINANTTVVAVFTKNEEKKYGTHIGGDGKYKDKSLYIISELGDTTFNFGTDKGIEITKTVKNDDETVTVDKKIFGVKYLYDKGIEVEEGGKETTATFAIGIIDEDDLLAGTFSFRVLKSLEGLE